jgi:hypothetical protein
MTESTRTQPDDLRLVGLVQGIVQRTTVGGQYSDEIHFIDKNYRIETVHRAAYDEEFILRRVNKMRQQMLQSGNLLAVVMTGFSIGWDGSAVCQYYPAADQVETYTMFWPRPQITWGPNEHDEPDQEDLIESYNEIWSLDQLLERRQTVQIND